MPTVFLILLFTINISAVTIAAFILLLLLLFYCCRQITVTTDKFLREKSFSGVVELTTQLLRLINILWLPLCWINKLGLYYLRRLLRSPTLVGHQPTTPASVPSTPPKEPTHYFLLTTRTRLPLQANTLGTEVEPNQGSTELRVGPVRSDTPHRTEPHAAT